MGKKNKYTQKYLKGRGPSSIPQIVLEETIKEILKIAEIKLKKEARELVVLDVGSGWGGYSFEIEKYVKKVVGVEPYTKTYNRAIENKKQRESKVEFHNLFIEDFHTKQKFDLALSITTVEHMSQAELSFKRIFSLLKPGGMIYITAPNKWWPIEQHYGIWFLGWLPLPLANLYIRILLGKEYSFDDCSYAKSFFGMKRLFNQFKCKYDFFIPSADALYLGCGYKNRKEEFIRRIGIWLIKKSQFFYAFSKGFIIITTKG